MRIDNIATGPGRRLEIAVIGSGISGLSAAWLLSQRHHVTLFEADRRLGGHSNTVSVRNIPVDTGFIVYNETTYPNLTAMFHHLGVATQSSNMSFAVSLDDGRLEYSGSGLAGLFAQASNLASPRYWSMLRDLVRFYREAPLDMPDLGAKTLGEYLGSRSYGAAFREDHLYPMAAAIWSTPAADFRNYPAAAFIRFCINHGLLQLAGRPTWRTVAGGSRSYVQQLIRSITETVTGCLIKTLLRHTDGVDVVGEDGSRRRFDHVVIATHADQALALLDAPSSAEKQLLGAFKYVDNRAFLHADPALMPCRTKVWSSWNYMSKGTGADRKVGVTYWMNRLQGIANDTALFVTLNPHREIRAGAVHHQSNYRHPRFDTPTMRAQRNLWSLQGARNTWFCGAYFGSGFHEDGLQAGLAVAEAIGGLRRPWKVPDDSGRIHVQALERAAMEVA